MKLKPSPADSYITTAVSLGFPDRLNIPARCGLAGHFTMTVSGGERGTVVLADFDNMVLDAGLDYLASGGQAGATYCQVGTGTTAVAANQTSLTNKTAHSNTYQRNWSDGGGTYVAGPPAYKRDYRTYRFGTGVATGNLTEVGIGWAATGGLFSRALIVDGGGAPTSITVLADETLDVTYTLRVYAPNDVTGSVTLAGIPYNYTMRAANMASNGSGSWAPNDVMSYGFANRTITSSYVYNGPIGATPGSNPSGGSVNDSPTVTLTSYTGGSLQRTTEYKWDLNQGNIGGGVKSMLVQVSGAIGSGTHSYQIEFSPNIPKDATKTLRLSFTFSLARAP